MLSHAQSAPARVRDFRHLRDVCDLHLRIRGRFGPDEFGAGANCLPRGLEIAHVHELDLESPRHEDIAQQLARAVIGLSGRDDVVARPERLENGTRCGQARAEGRGLAPAFERSRGLLERVPVRIVAARVNVTRAIAAIRLALKGGREMDRRRDGAGRWIDRVAGVHREVSIRIGVTLAAASRRARTHACAAAQSPSRRCRLRLVAFQFDGADSPER